MSDQLALQSSSNAGASNIGGVSGRRISADSFRMLSARLRKEPSPTPEIIIPPLMPMAALTAPELPTPPPAPDFEMAFAPVAIPPALEAVFAVTPPIVQTVVISDNPEEWPTIGHSFDVVAVEAPQPEPAAPEVPEFEVPSFEVPAYEVPHFEVPPFEVPTLEVREPSFAELSAEDFEFSVSGTAIAAPLMPEPSIAVVPAPEPEPTYELDFARPEPEPVLGPEPTLVPPPLNELTEAELEEERAENARADRQMLAIVHLIQSAPNLEDRTAYLAEVKEMQRLEVLAKHAQQEDYTEISLNRENLLLPEEVSETEQATFAAENLAPQSPRSAAGDEDAGALARSLLDMMSSGGSSLPQERALAADTLLRLLPKLPLKSMIMLSERVAMMDQPSPQLINKLIRDPRLEIAGYLLENCAAISDQDLTQVIVERDVAKMRLIARRRKVARAVSDQLLQLEDVSVMLTLVRNTGAEISLEGYQTLATFAARKTDILAPLCTRTDLPATIAFELFWQAPAQLRRYLLTRFLTDSETLSKILKITMATQGGDEGVEGREKISEDVKAALALISASKIDEGATALAEIAKIDTVTMARIISDRQGEPFAILLKAIGFPRGEVLNALKIIQDSEFDLIQRDRDLNELNNTFESLSFNKARVLITYWDWAILKTGPYAPAN